MARCRHKNASYLGAVVYVDTTASIGTFGQGWCNVPGQLRCGRCGVWLPLGPANETGEHAEAVAIEVRAAELACDDYDVALYHDIEWAGWNEDEVYSVGGGEPLRSFDLGDKRWAAGYLAIAIYNHDRWIVFTDSHTTGGSHG